MDKQQNIIKIAAAQFAPVFLNIQQSVECAVTAISEASKNKAQIIVFPEVFLPGYPDWVWSVPNNKSAILNALYNELLENALSIPDKNTEILCQAAKEHKINVAIGVNERNSEASNSSLFNTLLFISSQGEISGKRRKLIPTGGERLIWAQGDGSTFHAFNSPIGKLGGLICWENYMPLARQALYNQGIQILLAPTWDKSPAWQQSMQHIAREGGVFVISCCQALKISDIPEKYEFKSFYPDDREWINTGNSCIINPKGEIIAGPLSEKQDIIYADINLKQISDAKRMFDVAGHYARPDVFKLSISDKA